MKNKKLIDKYYSIMGDYGRGWEVINTEPNLKEANRSIKEYRQNEPQYKHKKMLTKEYKVISYYSK